MENKALHGPHTGDKAQAVTTWEVPEEGGSKGQGPRASDLPGGLARTFWKK